MLSLVSSCWYWAGNRRGEKLKPGLPRAIRSSARYVFTGERDGSLVPGSELVALHHLSGAKQLLPIYLGVDILVR
jgi:hypothetical protein